MEIFSGSAKDAIQSQMNEMALLLAKMLGTVFLAGMIVGVLLEIVPISVPRQIKNFLITIVSLIAFYYAIQWFLE
ncbi:hypothetical protein [Sediminibacillus halophilus]|uniref:Uncharacterized protein n=1 Tax=Sediminibacillus halophilus TaxID=482461 RepID=A0A1G9UFD6_9BACI|nr:hypothetical protein [Sediminibacillus halophilus]SDM58618.1 hypothetical protein SAMN05216244_2995 [Sediminibacillus halophilus]